MKYQICQKQLILVASYLRTGYNYNRVLFIHRHVYFPGIYSNKWQYPHGTYSSFIPEQERYYLSEMIMGRVFPDLEKHRLPVSIEYFSPKQDSSPKTFFLPLDDLIVFDRVQHSHLPIQGSMTDTVICYPDNLSKSHFGFSSVSETTCYLYIGDHKTTPPEPKSPGTGTVVQYTVDPPKAWCFPESGARRNNLPLEVKCTREELLPFIPELNGNKYNFVPNPNYRGN